MRDLVLQVAKLGHVIEQQVALLALLLAQYALHSRRLGVAGDRHLVGVIDLAVLIEEGFEFLFEEITIEEAVLSRVDPFLELPLKLAQGFLPCVLPLVVRVKIQWKPQLFVDLDM